MMSKVCRANAVRIPGADDRVGHAVVVHIAGRHLETEHVLARAAGDYANSVNLLAVAGDLGKWDEFMAHFVDDAWIELDAA